jgi:hypothetical protein
VPTVKRRPLYLPEVGDSFYHFCRGERTRGVSITALLFGQLGWLKIGIGQRLRDARDRWQLVAGVYLALRLIRGGGAVGVADAATNHSRAEAIAQAITHRVLPNVVCYALAAGPCERPRTLARCHHPPQVRLGVALAEPSFG